MVTEAEVHNASVSPTHPLAKKPHVLTNPSESKFEIPTLEIGLITGGQREAKGSYRDLSFSILP